VYWNFRKYWLVTDKIPNILKLKYTGRRRASWLVIHVQFGPLMFDTFFTQWYWCYCTHIREPIQNPHCSHIPGILTTHPPQDNVTDGVPGWCDWDPQNVTSAPLLLLVNPYISLYGICAQLPGLRRRQGNRREDRDFQVSWHITFVHCSTASAHFRGEWISDSICSGHGIIFTTLTSFGGYPASYSIISPEIRQLEVWSWPFISPDVEIYCHATWACVLSWRRYGGTVAFKLLRELDW